MQPRSAATFLVAVLQSHSIDDFSVLNNVDDVARIGNILGRIASNDEQIGRFASFNGSHLILNSQIPGAIESADLNDFNGIVGYSFNES